ncbi:hypothetical protein [Enterobacter hormaechei]|nr:hypothetical protein [Enterobacter hormaechei]
MRHRIQPGGFFDIKAQVGQFLLEASYGIFQSGVFAGDKRFESWRSLLSYVKRAMIRVLRDGCYLRRK